MTDTMTMPFRCAYCEFETSRRDLAELIDHVSAAHPDKTFLCGSRNHTPITDFKCDCWQREPNGDLTCTFCGSLSEDDLAEILAHFADGDPGYHFEPSTKGYKVYANRPGVMNASEGGIKFYGWHVNASHPDYEKRNALFERAKEKRRNREAV